MTLPQVLPVQIKTFNASVRVFRVRLLAFPVLSPPSFFSIFSLLALSFLYPSYLVLSCLVSCPLFSWSPLILRHVGSFQKSKSKSKFKSTNSYSVKSCPVQKIIRIQLQQCREKPKQAQQEKSTSPKRKKEGRKNSRTNHPVREKTHATRPKTQIPGQEK